MFEPQRWHLAENVHPVMLGLIPEMIHADDPRPVAEQIADNYAHGGGYRPFKGFEIQIDRKNPLNCRLQYPGDPAYSPRAWTKVRDELVLFLPHSWVCVIQPDDSFVMTRMD